MNPNDRAASSDTSQTQSEPATPKNKWQSFNEQTNISEMTSAENDAPQNNHSNEVSGILDHPDYHALMQKLTEMEAKSQEYWNKYLAEVADKENLRRRLQSEISKAAKFGAETITLEMVDVADNLERSLEVKTSDENSLQTLREGVELTLKQLLNVLQKQGVSAINPLNQPFNAAEHRAIQMQPSNKVPPNTILTVVQKGYRLHERVIRSAMVVVSKAE